jgi:hypothetical protein
MRRGALSIAGLCDYAAIGRTAAFAEIKAGRLIARKRGRSTIILIEDADAWLQSLPAVRPTISDAVIPEPASSPVAKSPVRKAGGSTRSPRRTWSARDPPEGG